MALLQGTDESGKLQAKANVCEGRIASTFVFNKY